LLAATSCGLWGPFADASDNARYAHQRQCLFLLEMPGAAPVPLLRRPHDHHRDLCRRLPAETPSRVGYSGD
jgi:hypothetical protein